VRSLRRSKQKWSKSVSDYSLFVLEHHARRPLKFMPEIILDDLALSQVSIFAAQRNRTSFRPHANDQRGEQSQNPARSYGEHQPANHARGYAGRFREVDD